MFLLHYLYHKINNNNERKYFMNVSKYWASGRVASLWNDV
jgi:hypothetical protein